MAELRWLLLLVGIGVIGAVYLYTRYKPRIAGRMRALPFRREPSIGDSDSDAPSSLTDDSTAELEFSIPQPPVPSDPRKVVAIRLMSKDTSGFKAEQLILILRELGLRHGQFGIFHRFDEDEEGSAVFSVASLVEPGSFDLTKVKTDRYPGISLFMTLPGPRSGVGAFDDMLSSARELAQRLEGYLLDEQGGTLSIQRERYIREEIIQFEYQESG